MTSAAAIVADLRRSIELLDKSDDPAHMRTAQVLTRLLAGDNFEAAAELLPGWRQYVQHKERDAALRALVNLHPDVDGIALARHIMAGVNRANIDRPRPDGESGYFHDLACAGFDLAERTCRARISEMRGRYNPVIGHAHEAPLPPKLELKIR